MRAHSTITVIAVGLVGCSPGQVGGPESQSCELAAQHVATCMGQTTRITSVTGTCDVQQAARAEQVLQTPCSALTGQRSTLSLKDTFCNLLPFLCSGDEDADDSGRYFRINDCWPSPHHAGSFCYDRVKINPDGFCTEMMERWEWQTNHFNHVECLQPDGDRCRLARVCEPFQHKGQCVAEVLHHHDQPMCQRHHGTHDTPSYQGPCPPDHIFTSDDACYVPRTVGYDGSCNEHITGEPRPDLCRFGLSCVRTPEVIVDYGKPGVSWVRIWRCFP